MWFTGEIDAALFTELLGPLAKPRPATSTGRDPRGAPQRLGDAFVDILRLAAGNEDVRRPGALVAASPKPVGGACRLRDLRKVARQGRPPCQAERTARCWGLRASAKQRTVAWIT